jgi:hypothetical protein
MDKKRAFMRAGYSVLFALLALLFYITYDSRQENPGESLSLFSGRSISIVSILCLIVGIAAGAAAIFFVVRAFYLAFTRPEPKKKDDHDA